VANYVDRKYGAGSYQAALDDVDRYRKELYDKYFESKSTDR